ncbi:MAG: hypothetical protein M3443_19805 [Actinomycetota bacterium]|nr:hypothetical protein [Actinomycetota bacterium]
MTDQHWPVVELDPVRRLGIIAASIPGVSISEIVVAAPFEAVWAVAADLESELPHWVFADLRSVRLTRLPDSDRLVARVVGHSGLRARFDVVLRPGWCLMQSRFLLGGMAAVENGGATRFALLSGVRGPLRPLAPAARLVAAGNARRALERFVRPVDLRAY